MENIETHNTGHNTCEVTGKVCYSQRKAGEIINSLKKHRKSDHLGRNKNMPKRSYVCKGCGSYHLTHETFIKNKKQRHELYAE